MDDISDDLIAKIRTYMHPGIQGRLNAEWTKDHGNNLAYLVEYCHRDPEFIEVLRTRFKKELTDDFPLFDE